jgi:hypothetical protein
MPRFVQPYDGRVTVPVFSPAPLGYKVRKGPQARKLWTFCQSHSAAMTALNTLRAQGYLKAVVEPLYL